MRVAGVNRRQRFNLSGARSLGVDASLMKRLDARWEVELNASLLRARADKGAAPFRRLVQRPSLETLAALNWSPTPGLSLRGEWRHVGGAVDLAPSGVKATLPPGDEINVRGQWRILDLRGGNRLSLTASVDNLADDVITPQLGLPLPGRSFRLGIRID